MSDPITREHANNRASVLELEQRAIARQAEEDRLVTDEKAVLDLEQKLMDSTPLPPPVPLEDDGFINNTWEVTGSAVEQAIEQSVRTLGDVTSFAEDVGPQFVWGDKEWVGEGEGIGIPFTDKRIDFVSNKEFQEKALAYEVATGKEPWSLRQFDVPDVDRPDSAAGKMTEGFLRWGLVFAATRKATGVGNIAGSVIADFTAFDPHEARLADMISEWGEGNPVFDNAVTEFLSADPSDSGAEGRLKNAVEGLLIGGAIEGFMHSVRWLRGYRAAKKAAGERRIKDEAILTPEEPPKGFKDDTDIPNFEDAKKKPEYFAENKNQTVEVVKMSPDEYLENVADGFIGQGGTRATALDNAINPELVDEYAEAMLKGDEFPQINLDYDGGFGQEGRHRAAAAKKAGIEEIDVAVRYATDEGMPAGVRHAGTRKAAPKVDEPAPKVDEPAPTPEQASATIQDVAFNRLKAAFGNADPAKLKAIKTALEDGKLSEAHDLIDFNSETVDWEGLAAQVETTGDVNEIRKLINTFSEVFEDTMTDATGYQSMAETAAKAVGGTANDVLKLGRDVKGGKGLAARMAGADTMVYQSAQRLRALAKKANASGADKDMMAFYRHIDLHATLQATVKGARAEIARALHKMRDVKVDNLDDFKEFDELLRNSTGLDANQRRAMAQKMADITDVNKLNRMTRSTGWQRARDVWIEVYVNGLLSSLSTFVLNNASNTLKLIEGVTERYFAAGLGAARNAARRVVGKESLDRVQFREANAYLYGTIVGLDRAMRIPFKGIFDTIKADGVAGLKNMDSDQFGTVWRAAVEERPVLDTRMRVDADTKRAISKADNSEISIRESLRTMKLSKVDWDSKAINALGKIVRIPGRLIITSDEFFKQITYHQHLASQAYKDGAAIAQAKNLTGKKKAAVIERMHRNYDEFPPDEIRASAMDHARYQTFQSDLPNGMARDFESFINRNPIMKFVVPFYRTPVNIVKQTVIERTPLPFLKAHKSEIMRRIVKGGPEGDIALARMATGSMFIGWAVTQSMTGNITGGGLSTKNMRNTERLDNIPPYSVKIGKTWYQYNRLEPLGMLMGLAADIALASEYVQEEDEADMVEAMSLAVTVVTTNITDKTWFKGVAELVGALEDPKRFGPTYIKGQTRTMVTPYSSLLRRINVDHDELAREAWTWMDSWKANIPGFSDELPVRYDILGQPEYRQDYLGPSWASPVAQGVERDDPVYKELARLEFDYKPPTKDLFGTGEKVDAKTYSEVMKLKGEISVNGKTLHDALDDLFNKGLYTEILSDQGKADVAKSLISAYLRAAKMQYLKENPDVLDDVKEAKRLIILDNLN